MARGRILLVSAEPSVTVAVQGAIGEGYDIQLSGSPAAALAETGAYELALVDLSLPGLDLPALITGLREHRPGVPVVVVTGSDRRAQGFAARQAGAYAFLETPQDLTREKILVAVANAIEHRDLLRELAAARQRGAETLNLADRERTALLAALETTKWNKQAAARLLGLHRPTLYAKMRKHGIPQKRSA